MEDQERRTKALAGRHRIERDGSLMAHLELVVAGETGALVSALDPVSLAEVNRSYAVATERIRTHVEAARREQESRSESSGWWSIHGRIRRSAPIVRRSGAEPAAIVNVRDRWSGRVRTRAYPAA